MESMENLFDCLCSALMLPANNERFVRAEGIELVILMLRCKMLCRIGAYKVRAFSGLYTTHVICIDAPFAQYHGLHVSMCRLARNKTEYTSPRAKA